MKELKTLKGLKGLKALKEFERKMKSYKSSVIPRHIFMCLTVLLISVLSILKEHCRLSVLIMSKIEKNKTTKFAFLSGSL